MGFPWTDEFLKLSVVVGFYTTFAGSLPVFDLSLAGSLPCCVSSFPSPTPHFVGVVERVDDRFRRLKR